MKTDKTTHKETVEIKNETVTPVGEDVDAVAADSKESAPKVETPTAVDYSKYASMAETPAVNERRTFDFISVSGAVETEVVGDGMEKRKPASAIKLFLTQPKTKDDRFVSEEVKLPLTIVPIKYRQVMEQRTGAKGEILVLKSSEFNGKLSDKVVITRFGADGKVVEKYGPMTAIEARNTFKNSDGKNVLRDKAHVYALHSDEIVRFVVKGAGLWEDTPGLVNGKTEASRARYAYLSEYLSTFPMNEPYFLYEMNIDAAYRDHGTVKFYRPTFTKGARINSGVEKKVLESLEDLHKYFTEQDKAIAEFVATNATPAAGVVVEDDGDEDKDKAF